MSYLISIFCGQEIMPFCAYIIVILKATVISKLCIIIGKTFDLAVSQEFVVTFFSKSFLDSECHIHYAKDSGHSKHNEKKVKKRFENTQSFQTVFL